MRIDKMKYFFCLVFLIHYCCCSADKITDTSEHKVKDGPRKDFDHREDHIEKPCVIHDVECIRGYLAYNFGCSPVHGPAPDPYYIEDVPLIVASVNITAVLNDIQLKGLNTGKIETFFTDKKAGTLVLEVVFDKLVVYSGKTVVYFHRKGEIPVVASDFSDAEFKGLSYTLTIRYNHDINLTKSHVFAFISDPKPKVVVGPGLSGVPTSDIQGVSNIGLTVQETMATQAPIYMAAYLQTKICDSTRH